MTSFKAQTAFQDTPSEDTPPSRNEDVSLANLSAFTTAILNEDAPLNQIELKSVTAMVSYVAYTQKIDVETVRGVLTTAFGVDNIKKISVGQYDDAIRFLVDFRFDEIIN